ncbi:beta-microseminoprotein-like isoform X1 [Gigantopelta aegis]|uniref:beta-microseminoprotein-like isoform X1 n=1 Tax=Gigantopelta aegis TaxID=1735272 RepID=UPI001B88CE2B|nr:beta-microseminoprotein-like isoform X1 [Gigantopelta aegis]
MFRILLSLSAFVFTVNGFCFSDMATTEIKSDGTIVTYCKYGEHIMQPGDHIRTDDCIECTCQNAMLSCCGYGIKAGVFAPPPGCIIKADGCKMLIVKADDESRDCMTGEKLANAQ